MAGLRRFPARPGKVAIMITGVAVLGMLAGSLVPLFNLEPTSEKERADDAAPARPGHSVPAELAVLRAQLREVEHRLGQLARWSSSQTRDESDGVMTLVASIGVDGAEVSVPGGFGRCAAARDGRPVAAEPDPPDGPA